MKAEINNNTSLLKYPTYKDSGVEWLGEIPSHWEVTAIKHVLEMPICDGPHTTPQLLDEGIPFISAEAIKNGEVDFNKRRGYISEQDHLTFSKKYKPRRNDIYMVKSGATTGNVAIVKTDIEFSIWSPLAVFRANENKIIHECLFKYLESTSFRAGVELSWSFGTQQNIGMGILSNLTIPIPPLPEQTAIAAFLDRKTALIGQAISIKQQQIELLKERRQVLIHKAVTRGLNPDVKMKDSGVEWIGEIPEHWEVVRLKYLCEFINDGTHGSYARVEDGYRLLSVRNMIEDRFVFRDDDSRISEKNFVEISSKFKIRSGDVNLAIVGATLGKVAIVEHCNEPFVTQRSVCTIRVKEEVLLNSFLFFFIKSPSFQSYLWLNAGFSAQPGVYLGTIQSSVIPLPNSSEQSAIIDFLNKSCLKYSTAISIKEQEIEKLKEYKATLINSAVTGKIKLS